MKIAANIDSSSGSFEKVLRYLPPMMNQLTIPMMIIGLEPFETFKIDSNAEVVRSNPNIDESLLEHKVAVTHVDDYSLYKGNVINVDMNIEGNATITVQKSRNNRKEFEERVIRFLEILN